MSRTQAQLKQAAAEVEAWLNSLDPDTTPAQDISDLRAVAVAMNNVVHTQADLEAAVHTARSNGRSWGRIATALGMSRQGARQRYEQKQPKG